MPELPEVETIKNQIAPTLPLLIKRVTYSDVSTSIVKNKEFSPLNKTLHKIERIGKVLLLHFNDMKDGHFIAISGLGMSGGWRLSDKPIKENHTHIKITGENNKGEKYYLGYVDPRRFGNFHLFKPEGAKQWLTRLGADVSSQDFTAAYIMERFERYPNKKLKPFLLEQNHFAGVGNYMASEICARAAILPERVVKTLDKSHARAIIKATKKVLDDTLTTGGTTFSGGYVDATGEKGQGVKNLVVFYQKVCGLCKRTQVIKTTLAGRGTYHCPRCQK
jgi:formamidopyrimidine-DNA glycosylase